MIYMYIYEHVGLEELKRYCKNVWDMIGGTSGLEITAGQKTMSSQK